MLCHYAETSTCRHVCYHQTFRLDQRLGTIRLKTSMLDKDKFTRLPGVSHYISFDDRESKAIISSLSGFSAAAKEQSSKKRAREQEDANEDVVKMARNKRIRTTDPDEGEDFVMGFFTQMVDDDVEMD